MWWICFSRWPPNMVDVFVLRNWKRFLLNPWPPEPILWYWTHYYIGILISEIYTFIYVCGGYVFSRWPPNVVDVIVLRTWKCFLWNPWPPKPILWHWNHDCRSLNFRDTHIYMCGGYVFQDGRQNGRYNHLLKWNMFSCYSLTSKTYTTALELAQSTP